MRVRKRRGLFERQRQHEGLGVYKTRVGPLQVTLAMLLTHA